MKFWSNLGLVRTLKLGEFKENRSLSFRDIGVRDSRPHTEYGQWASLKKIVRSVFVISVFEIADAIPDMGSMGHFQVSSTHIREF